jgi:phosphomannomutase/phosphoglucomutase
MTFILPDAISKTIFRAYDIRGIVDQNMNVNDVYAIGRSLGSEAKSLNQCQIVLGRDSRLSSPYFANAL